MLQGKVAVLIFAIYFFFLVDVRSGLMQKCPGMKKIPKMIQNVQKKSSSEKFQTLVCFISVQKMYTEEEWK